MRPKPSRIALALSALCIATTLPAQSGGRDLPRGFRSLAGVTLNQDSAITIRAKLGATRERRVQSANGAYINWCYTPPDTSHHALLELISDASDLASPGHALNVIRLRANAPATDRQGCVPLRSAELSTPAGLQLGLSVADVEKLLGSPTRTVGDTLAYLFDAKEFLQPGTPAYEIWDTLEYRESCFDAGPPFAHVEAFVLVFLHDGRVAELRLGRYDQSVC